MVPEPAPGALTAWRRDYNEVRPHSGCDRMPPALFTARHRQKIADAAKKCRRSFTLETGPTNQLVARRKGEGHLILPVQLESAKAVVPCPAGVV